MRISDFELLGTVGQGLDLNYLAGVTVTTGWLFWRKSSRRQIFRELGNHWVFADTGEFCPKFQCSNLERVWRATTLFSQLPESNGGSINV